MIKVKKNTNEKEIENTVETKSGIKRRGFASMDPERRKELAKQGGKKAWKMGKAHRWNKETASKAGKIGGSR